MHPRLSASVSAPSRGSLTVATFVRFDRLEVIADTPPMTSRRFWRGNRGMRRERPGHVSPETYLFLLAERDRLAAEVHRLTVDRDHWYMAANYTPDELAEMYHRASKGLDENGAWLWPDSVRTTK